MTKNPKPVLGLNSLDVLEWANSQSRPFTNAQLYEAFPSLEPNHLRVILYRLINRGLIDRHARGLWAPKGTAPLEPEEYPAWPVPGTQVHLVHEALREFEGPASVSELSEATGLPKVSVSAHLTRLKTARLVTSTALGVWVFNT